MAIFTKDKETKPVNTIFKLPVDDSIGTKGLITSAYVKEQAEYIYPSITGIPKEEVKAFLDSGIVGPLQAQAEGATREKRVDIYNEVIEVTALDQKTPEQAIAELETLREDNPFLKAYVSPAVVEALKQSDNVLARQMAQGKLANVLIASEILNNKLSESSDGFINGIGDFADVAVSELPIVSSFNVERRKELRDRFIQVLDSSDDPSVVSAELQSIVDEAADMGFFTDANRFYMNDFLNLTLEEGVGPELGFQRLMSVADILAATTALGDTGKLIGMTRKSVKETSEALMEGVLKDNPAGAVDPAYWKESMLLPERIGPRPPIEAQAVKDVELGLQGKAAAIEIRLASGSSIDDDLFEAFSTTVIEQSKKRAKDSGNLRLIDTNVNRDPFDNLSMDELYGTTKGAAFTSEVAAKKYAEQIAGEVVPSPTGGFVVKKATNLPTGWYSQGVTPEDIIKDLSLYRSVDTDELGRGFFAHFGSPLSQTDATNNAILKQGEAARAKALELIERDVAAQLKLVGREGKEAVEKVFTELRDGSLAHLREAPTTGAFSDYFFKINNRQPTDAEVRLYELKLDWNDTDWFLSADMHFKREVNRGIEILIPQDGLEVPASKVSTESVVGRQVWDADAGKYVDAGSLPADRVVYRLVTPTEFGGKLHDLVASATPKTRALKHTDVMGYNAGGSRLYASNRTNFIVKQETEYALADGVVRKGNPRALMVAKTEKEALKAQTEINSIVKTLHGIADPKAFTKAEDYLNVIKTKYKDASLNDLIARNSGWNTDVHSVETLVEFAAENKLDLRKTVQFVGDNQPLVSGDDVIGDITFKDVATAPGLLKFGDFRRDNVLMGYGGQKVPTIAPFESISRSLMSSVARQTNMAYETRSINRLFRTAIEKNLVPRENIAQVRNMSLRQKARNLIIDTSTDAGKKLELERKKILTRLEKQRVLDNAYHKAKDSLANILWDKGWKKTAEKIDSLSADPVAGTRGIVFDAYLGLGAVDQFYVQASQVINIVAMSEKTLGLQAAAVAPYFRLTFLNGHPGPTTAMGRLMSKVIGTTPEQFVAMMDTFKASGRGAVQASVADLGEDSGGKLLFNKVREVGRIPYNEGETLARITAHISSSLEYLKKYGANADLTSQHATRWVMNKSDQLTNAMTSTSRHPIEQLPMLQFMSYSLRMGEYLLGGLLGGKSVLTPAKRAKLFTFQLGFFGASALPFVGAYLDWYNFKYGTDLKPDDYYTLRHGAIDSFIRYTTGVETELGRRLAWGEGVFNTIQDLQTNSPVQVALGPAFSLGQTVLDSTSKMLWNMKVGGTDLLAEDTMDVFRSIKSVNLAYNGYMALRYDMYRSRRGDVISDDVTTGEAVAIALGLPVAEVNGTWRNIELIKKDSQHYKDLANRVNGLWNDLYDERLRNGHGTDRERKIISALETVYAIYTPYEIQQMERYVDKKFVTMNEELMIEMMKREAAKGATE